MKNKILLFCTAFWLMSHTTVLAQSCSDPCELIGNGSFKQLSPAVYGNDSHPFDLDLVDCWKDSHATAHLLEFPSVPGCPNPSNPDPCFDDWAVMWAFGSTGTNWSRGEGIFQDQAILTGHKYFYSYKVKRWYPPAPNTSVPVNSFYMHFINYNASFGNPMSSYIPVPVSSQQVSVTNNISNGVPIQVCGAITANSNYQAVWFHPEQNAPNTSQGFAALSDVHLYEASAGADINMCSGQTVTLGIPGCAIPGATYTWSGTGLSSTSAANPTVTLINSGVSPVNYTYNVSITFCGHTITDQVVVTVHPNLFGSLSIMGYAYKCTGQSGTYASNMTGIGYTYNWLVTGGTVTSPTAPSTNIVFTTAGTQTITLTVTNTLTGCTRTVYYTVNVHLYPPVPIVTNAAVYACPGTYNYQISNFNPSNVYTINVSGGTLASPLDALGYFMVNWTGIAGSITITSSAPSPYSCTASTTVNVAACCSDATAWMNLVDGFNDTATEVIAYNGGSTVTSKLITVNGTLTIDNNIVFNSCTLKMGDNAKINVLNGKTVTFNNSTLTICTQPWDGIYVSSPTAHVIMNTSSAEHARNAIYSQTGGKFTVTGSAFKDNAIGIRVANHPTVAHTGTVKGSLFYTSAPIITGVPFVGVSLLNIYDITIGDPTLTTVNGFRDLNNGVSTGNANYKLYSNRFVDIPGTSPYVSTNNAGVYTMGNGNNAVVPNILISRNSFVTNENAIVNAFVKNVRVLDNDFSQITVYGYYGYEPPNSSPLSQVLVERNDMNNVNKGVYLLESALTNSADIMVRNNTITNTEVGVYVSGFQRPYVRSNCITLKEPSASGIHYGIQGQNCSSMTADLNTVKGTGSPNVTIGIQADLSPFNEIVNNYIDGCLFSMTTLGDCNNSNLKCNKMLNYSVGYYQVNGPIGPQGSGTSTHYNKWYGGPNKIRVFVGDGNLSPFYVRTIAPYVVNAGESTADFPTPIAFPVPVTLGTYPNPDMCTNLYPSLPCSAHLVDGGDDDDGGGDGDDDDDMRMMAMYDWNMDEDIEKTQAEDYLQKELMYKVYLEDPAVFEKTDASLFPHNFSDNGLVAVTLTGNEIGTIDRLPVQDASIESEIPTDGPYEHAMANLQYRVNTMVKATIERDAPYVFSVNEVEALATIAALCPIDNGRAVYAARTILQPILNTKFVNECELVSVTEGAKEKSMVTSASPTLSVYPNPADESVTVTLAHASNELNVWLTDLAGKKIQELKITGDQPTVSFSTVALHNGLYMIRIYEGGNMVAAEKIVIIH